MSLYLIVVSVVVSAGLHPIWFSAGMAGAERGYPHQGQRQHRRHQCAAVGRKGVGCADFCPRRGKGYVAVMVAEWLARGKDPTSLRNLAITAALFCHPGPYVPCLAALQGRQRRGHRLWRLRGVVLAGGALRAGTLGRCRDPHPVCFPGFHSGRGGASVPYPVAVAGQVRLRIRNSDVCLLLDCHREAPGEYRAPVARHGAPLLSRIAIVGSGSWGTALALSLARRGDHSIALWSHSAAVGILPSRLFHSS